MTMKSFSLLWDWCPASSFKAALTANFQYKGPALWQKQPSARLIPNGEGNSCSPFTPVLLGKEVRRAKL